MCYLVTFVLKVRRHLNTEDPKVLLNWPWRKGVGCGVGCGDRISVYGKNMECMGRRLNHTSSDRAMDFAYKQGWRQLPSRKQLCPRGQSERLSSPWDLGIWAQRTT